ncbi:MAG TPA: energy transducer TonB [Niabella sp.]
MKYTITLLFSVFVLTTNAQSYRYYFDKQMNPTTKEKAAIYARGIKIEDGITADFYIKSTNKKVFSCDYTDSTLSVMNGRAVDYFPDGKASQLKYYKMDILEGLFQRWDSLGRMTDSAIYQNGKVVYNRIIHYWNNNKIINEIITDSINNTLTDLSYDSAGAKIREIIFTADKGIERKYDKNGSIIDSDSLNTREQKDASYPGNWATYLTNTLDGSVPYKKGAPRGKYKTTTQFIIEKDGSLSDIKAFTNNGYGMEEEAIRVIKKSGKWTPAKQYGKSVKAYRKQSITFIIN